MKNILTLNDISNVIDDIFTEDYTVGKDVENPVGILLRSFKMHDYNLPESVIAIGRAGAGTNNIPVDEYAKKGVVVFNTPGANANAVKELVVAALLLGGRKISSAMDWVKTLKGKGDEVMKLVEKGKSNFAGKEIYVDLTANRLTAPSIGMEVGSYMSGYQYFYQGFYQAPHTVAQAIKGGMLFAHALTKLGFNTLPKSKEPFKDIICSIEFDTAEQLIKFCQTIQYASPIDSFVTPMPWDMPGYNEQVIMAAGCFVQGASIELSCDSPIKAPYVAYLQGGLSFEHTKLALEFCIEKLKLL